MYVHVFIRPCVDGHLGCFPVLAPVSSAAANSGMRVFFLWPSNIPLCICTATSFIYSSVNGHLGCFRVLAIVNSAAMNNVHVSFSVLVSSGHIPRSGIVWPYGGFIPRFLRNLHTIFHSGYINLHSHQQFKRVPFPPHPFQHLFIDCRLFDDGHSDWYEVVSHSFDLHFSNNEQC